MNNLLLYCGLVDAKIRPSDKDLPVIKFMKFKKEATNNPNKYHSFFNHRLNQIKKLLIKTNSGSNMLGFKLFFFISFFIVWIEAGKQNFRTTEDPCITQVLKKGKHRAMINSRKLKLILI